MTLNNAISVTTNAIIPVAGLGTRFLPVSRCVPKTLL
ncbi:MAG: UTP--glucose-1-phosphate uridylyltransferase, partial [Chloroflexi bacterium]|nr:UTP--glucose-1-phosphate uridylyltransferase [Chloroflexota bacterium]